MGMQYNAAAVDEIVAEQLAASEDTDRIVDLLEAGTELGKMWNAAQVLIAGSLEAQEPLLTGRPIGEDLGYGEAHLASPDDVNRVASGLAELSRAELAARFDPAALAALDVYPSIWDEDPDLLRDEVVDAAMRLVELYRAAAADHQAIIAAIL